MDQGAPVAMTTAMDLAMTTADREAMADQVAPVTMTTASDLAVALAVAPAATTIHILEEAIIMDLAPLAVPAMATRALISAAATTTAVAVVCPHTCSLQRVLLSLLLMFFYLGSKVGGFLEKAGNALGSDSLRQKGESLEGGGSGGSGGYDGGNSGGNNNY